MTLYLDNPWDDPFYTLYIIIVYYIYSVHMSIICQNRENNFIITHLQETCILSGLRSNPGSNHFKNPFIILKSTVSSKLGRNPMVSLPKPPPESAAHLSTRTAPETVKVKMWKAHVKIPMFRWDNPSKPTFWTSKMEVWKMFFPFQEFDF